MFGCRVGLRTAPVVRQHGTPRGVNPCPICSRPLNSAFTTDLLLFVIFYLLFVVCCVDVDVDIEVVAAAAVGTDVLLFFCDVVAWIFVVCLGALFV